MDMKWYLNFYFYLFFLYVLHVSSFMYRDRHGCVLDAKISVLTLSMFFVEASIIKCALLH